MLPEDVDVVLVDEVVEEPEDEPEEEVVPLVVVEDVVLEPADEDVVDVPVVVVDEVVLEPDDEDVVEEPELEDVPLLEEVPEPEEELEPEDVLEPEDDPLDVESAEVPVELPELVDAEAFVPDLPDPVPELQAKVIVTITNNIIIFVIVCFMLPPCC